MPRRHLPVVPDDLRDPGLPEGVFSHSQYGLFKKCPKAYEFRYVQGLKRPPSALQFKGTLVHAGAEEAHYHLQTHATPPPLEAQKAVVARAFEAGRAEVEDWGDEKPGQVKDAAIAGYAAYHAKALPRVHPVGVEEYFLARVGTVPVRGFIDLVDHVRAPTGPSGVPDPGRIVIADLKTSSSGWSQDDVDRDTQLTLYSLVRGVPTVRVDNVVHLKAGPDFRQRESLRDAHAKRIFVEDLEETADLVKRGVFPRTAIDSWACSPKWCGFWSLCRGRRT